MDSVASQRIPRVRLKDPAVSIKSSAYFRIAEEHFSQRVKAPTQLHIMCDIYAVGKDSTGPTSGENERRHFRISETDLFCEDAPTKNKGERDYGVG
jgi:hypothetical protein